MRWLVLPLALLALGAASLVVRGGDGDETGPTAEAEPEAVRLASEPDRTCGDRRGPGGHPTRVEVVGVLPCRAARRVLARYYAGRDTTPWTCGGPDRVATCFVARYPDTIRARFHCRQWTEPDRADCLRLYGPP